MHLLLGKETIIDSIGDSDGAPSFEISPLSFYQVNPTQTARLYDAVYNALPEEIINTSVDTLIYDIYCGIGTIGMYLLSRLNKHNFSLVGVEYVSSAVENAKKNAVLNGFSSRADFLCGDASLVTPTVISKYGKPSLIILDPPRKGCDASLIETVLSAEADCVIYVSCNPSTLARDMKLLCADKYVCTSIQPVDMFPQSSHVECVCCFKLA
jgi:23S rRNA (uracil1939-C5)-methyltransferase